MPFHVFVNSTSADAVDMNDNFAFIGDGTRLPYTTTAGGSLTAVDATYDLGGSITTWRTLHCQNLNIAASITTNNKSFWIQISETTLADTAASIEVTGLNGDVDIEYMIIYKGVAHAVNSLTQSNIIFNNDSAANYGTQRIDGQSTAATALRGTGQTKIDFGNMSPLSTTIQAVTFVKAILHAKTGNERTMIQTELANAGETFVFNVRQQASIWNDTSSTLTSIKLIATNNNFGTNTTLQIWSRR